MTEATDELRVYEGARPTRTGDLTLEGQGMAPIPEDQRYGGVYRMFTVWFTPNMELSGVFAGTLAVVFGLGFGLGLVAIVIGTIIGSLPVAILCTWGPRTGTAQVPLARLPFGKTIVLPGTVQWLSSIAWDALVGLFGGQAAQLLFHVPFWVGVAIVLLIEGAVSVYGYEFVHRLQEWGSAILIVLFLVLTVKIFQHHVVLPHNTVHGGVLFGAVRADGDDLAQRGDLLGDVRLRLQPLHEAQHLQGGHLLADPGRADRVVRLGGDHRAGRGQRAGQPDRGRRARPDGRRLPRRAGADRDRVRLDHLELDERLHRVAGLPGPRRPGAAAGHRRGGGDPRVRGHPVDERRRHFGQVRRTYCCSSATGSRRSARS